MNTMPLPVLKAMRGAVRLMLAVVRRWEDKNADPGDYRMAMLNDGLWQASDAMRQVIAGEFQPMWRQEMLRQAPLRELPQVVPQVLGEEYTRELLREAPIPLRPID
jgi:hypothetical protein